MLEHHGGSIPPVDSIHKEWKYTDKNSSCPRRHKRRGTHGRVRRIQQGAAERGVNVGIVSDDHVYIGYEIQRD